MIKRINLFSGPSSGKSTTAALLFANLKRLGYKAELVREYVKDWAYQNRPIRGYDQFYALVKQMRAETIPLEGGADFIITDSPLFLNYCYAQKHGTPLLEESESLIRTLETQFPSINIFIDRKNKPYVQQGRFEALPEALEMDNMILDYLKKYQVGYTIFDYNDPAGMQIYIERQLKNGR